MLHPMLTPFCFVLNYFFYDRGAPSRRVDDSTRAAGFGDCAFLHAIFLKRSKIDTSQNVKVSFATKLGDRRARASCSRTRVSSDGSGKKTRPERLKKPASKWKDVDIQPSQEFS